MTNSLPVLACAIFLVAAFVWLVFLFRAPSHLKRVLVISQEAAAVLRNPAASDDEKEKMAQRSSVKMFGMFFLILLSFAGALLAPVAVIWLLSLTHLVSFQAVMAMTMSVTFLVTCTVLGCAWWLLWPRLRGIWASPTK